MAMHSLFWIFQIFLLTPTAVDTQVANSCEDESWTYHSHTDTCFKYDDNNYKGGWQGSASNCAAFYGGSSGTRPGHLARIDDHTTNTFVQEMVPDVSYKTWIGLHFSLFSNDISWQGFDYEVPQYLRLKGIRPSESYPHTYISNHMWGLEKKDFIGHPAICQHYPLPSSQVTCPTTPVRENSTLDRPMNCDFFFNLWDTVGMSWTDSNGRRAQAVTCSKFLQECDTLIDGFKGTQRQLNNKAKVSLSLDSRVTRNDEGTWECSIYNRERSLIDSKSCEIRVYEPPAPATCSVSLDPTSLRVECLTSKVYPYALSRWSYRYNDQAHYTTISDANGLVRSDQQLMYEEGKKYFKSKAYITLTVDGKEIQIKNGTIHFQVLFYPAIDNPSSSFIEAAGSKSHAYIKIDVPSDPLFSLAKSSTRTGPMIKMREGDDLELTCEVGNGIPSVESTTISCDFPINDVGGAIKTATGNFSQITTKVTSEMSGRRCFCWGKHITGTTKTTTLTIQVELATPMASESSGLSTSVIIVIVLVSFVANFTITVLAAIFVFRRLQKSEQNTPIDTENAVPVEEQSNINETAIGFEEERIEDIEVGGLEYETIGNSDPTSYNVLQRDDPNYINLNSEHPAEYEKIDTSCQGNNGTSEQQYHIDMGGHLEPSTM